MSDLFKKNIEYIQTYNPELYQRLKNEELVQFDLNTNLAGEYNILIDGKPVHSIVGAQSEADEIYDELKEDSKNLIHVVFGMGLGYLPEKLGAQIMGDLIVFEPNLKMLRFVFEIADFSELLSKNNVYVVSSVEELAKTYGLIYKFNRGYLISALDFHKSTCQVAFKSFEKELCHIHEVVRFNHNYLTHATESAINSMFERFDLRAKLPLLDTLKNSFKNKPAVIASAGPSLGKNVDVLKKHREKIVLFTVGTAMKTLSSNGISPDFLSQIEKFYSGSFFEGISLADVNLLIEPYSSAKLLDLKTKNTFITSSYESNVNHLFSELCGLKPEYFEAKGTVAYHALYAAKMLGCNPIILLGQDLAYVDGKCYSCGSVLEDLICVKDEESAGYKLVPKDREKLKNAYFPEKEPEEREEILENSLKNLNSELCFVDSVAGGVLPTSANYKNFISYFEDFAKRHGDDLNLYNTSNGAQIRGFDHVFIDDKLKTLSENIDVSGKISAKIRSKTSIINVRNNLRCNKNFLVSAMKKLNAIVEDLNNNPSDKHRATSMFESFNMLRMQNTLLRLLTVFDYNYMTLHIRVYGHYGGDVFLESNKNTFLSYYKSVYEKCEAVLKLVDENIERINESSNTKG